MKKRITSAKQDRVDIFHEQTLMILKLLGYENAFVTDKSTVSDFLTTEYWHFAVTSMDGEGSVPIVASEQDKQTILESNDLVLKSLTSLLGNPVKRTSKISELAEALYFKNKVNKKQLH